MVLRLYRLDALSMSLDEGFTWAVAGQPVSRLLQIQPLFDSGKLAVYGLLLHYWIEIFGDSLRSMRGLSGAIDTLSILLMFAVVRELYQVFANGELQTGELAGGFAAFIFATNVAVVQSARTARMYPLMTAAELAQIFFFVRSQRHGGALNCILTSVFIALAIATNFTAAFILLSEALWLAYLLIARRRELAGADLHVAGPVLALMGGLGLLLPWMSAATILMRGTTRYRDFGWIVYRPPMYWSYEVLRGNAGNKSLFRLFLALAAFGLWRHRSWAPLVPMFMAVAAVGPFVAVAVASLFGIPMMVDRYVLIAVIAFLGLAAIGAASFESKLGQALVFALIVRLSVQALRHSSAFLVDWKKAVAMACAESAADAEIGVVPGYAVDVVRYHLPLQRRPFAVGLDSQCGNSQILIVNPGRFIPQAYMSKLNACYARLLGRATRVEVRSR